MNRKKAVSNEIVVADQVNDVTDEDLNDAVDKLCERTLDYIFNSWRKEYNYYRFWDKSHLDPRGSWSSSSRFQTFAKQYKPKFDKFMERFSRVGIYPIQDVLPHGTKTLPIADADVLKRYQNFKQFDTVVDFSDHLFSTKPMEQPTERWVEQVGKQLKILEENLPETIFVRAYESRMDLLRAVIIGPKGTPYHDGLFFFDIYIPPKFPLDPPDVRYRSFGFGMNPHFMECGEVCLNLYTAWIQADEPLWLLYHTTVLQLLVNIQDRVLCADPLFLQPGLQDSGPSVVAEYFCLLYNEDILIKSLKSMVHIMSKPPKNFEAFVLGHFCDRADDILMACKAYKEGCCSYEFQSNVDACLGLANAFTMIRAAKLSLFYPEKGTVPATDDEVARPNKRGKKQADEITPNDIGGIKQRLTQEHTTLTKDLQEGSSQFVGDETFTNVFGKKRGHQRGIGKIIPKGVSFLSGGRSSSQSTDRSNSMREQYQQDMAAEREKIKEDLRAELWAEQEQREAERETRMQEQLEARMRTQMEEMFQKFSQDPYHRYRQERQRESDDNSGDN